MHAEQSRSLSAGSPVGSAAQLGSRPKPLKPRITLKSPHKNENMADEGAPQPRGILRGHKAQVHAAAFIRDNRRLLTGDAEGFVIAWDLTIMRPRAVWQAHSNAVLSVAGWEPHKVITYVPR